MGLQFKFIKTHPRPFPYSIEATVCSYELERRNGVVQIWSGLLPSRNPSTARMLGEDILSQLEEPLGTYSVDNNWIVDKKVEDVDHDAIYEAKKIAT